MSAPRIVLHQWEISPFCGKVRRILQLKGLAYEVVEYGGLKALAAAKLSPVGKLPVLEYNGEKIQDSSAIARFLEQRHPAPALYPADPAEAAQAHFLEDWADESLYWFEVYFRFMFPDATRRTLEIMQRGRPAWEMPVIERVSTFMLRRQLREQGIGKYDRDTVTAMFLEHLRQLDVVLARQTWLAGGEQASIADIAVAAQLGEIRRTSHLAPRLGEYPALAAWLARVPGG